MSAALTRNTITLAKRASVGGWVNARSTSSLKIAVAPTEKRSKTFVYNDVIWQHFEAKRYDQARFVFDDLLIDGVLPTDRTFHNLMTNAAVWNSPPFQVEEIISEMKLRGFAPSSIVYLMTMGNFLQHKQYLNVIKVYRDMKRLGANHSHRTYMCVIEAFAKSLMIDEAREVIDAMKQHGLQPDDKAYAHLIDACSQLDDKPRALMFFDELESSGTPLTSTVYNAVFQILKGDFNGLMQAYGHMKDREVVPNTVVFNTLVTACMKFQQWDHALEFVREYVSKHNMVYSRPLAATVLSVPLTEKSIEFLHHVVQLYIPHLKKHRETSTLSIQNQVNYVTTFERALRAKVMPELLDGLWDLMTADKIEPVGVCAKYIRSLEARLATATPDQQSHIEARLADVTAVWTSKQFRKGLRGSGTPVHADADTTTDPAQSIA